MKKYVIGDLHGNFKALKQVLNKVNFNYGNDHLYFLGDLADGHCDPHKCLLELLKIKNFYGILGNHDLFLKKWNETNIIDKRWERLKGLETIKHLSKYRKEIDIYFTKCNYYYIQNNIILCHGGFNHKRLLTKQKLLNFSINRKLFKTSFSYEKKKIRFNPIYDEKNSKKIKHIIIGHSPTKNNIPMFNSNLINIDTGAGNKGKLTIMDLDNFKYWQSSKSLY